STSPSRTSSSCRSGTYCRQMASPGALIRSTMAGEMRNSKLSAAWRNRSRSGNCSGPNLATSASSEARLFLRSSSCHDSMRQVLEIDHQIVTGRVVAGDQRRASVAASLVEGARGPVVGAGRRLDDDEPPVIRRELGLDGRQQLGADPLALPRGIDDDPVEVVGPGRPGRGAPAGVAHELFAGERAEKVILLVAVEGVVEQLHRDGDLVRPEQAGGRGELLKSCALGAADGTERAAHAPPWPPARRATPPRRCAVPARRSPTRRPWPCATGRRRRSGRGWG